MGKEHRLKILNIYSPVCSSRAAGVWNVQVANVKNNFFLTDILKFLKTSDSTHGHLCTAQRV